MPSLREQLPGLTDPAALSNAGDEFHYIWAARRALRLLDARTGAKAVVIESVATIDVPDDADQLLAIDLTEYVGGFDFDHAIEVDISQLKYSTRAPRAAWTTGRLVAARRGVHSSPIRRLADAYSAFLDRPRAERIARVRLRLVSNQPADDTLVSLLEHVRKVPQSDPMTLHRLSRGLDTVATTALKRLHEASALSSSDFADFIRLLDLTDCGQEARAYQGIRLFQESGAYLGSGRTQGGIGLLALISSHALPDTVGRPITAAEVRAALGVLDEADLLPAPPAFHLPPNVIETEALRQLMDAVQKSGTTLLVHGVAGSGKSTSLLALADSRKEAHFSLFDTFGDGTFAHSRWDRHSPFVVLTQLANDLATAGLCDFLLTRPPDINSMWRAFEKRLRQAATILERQSRLLVVAIDAADNGVVVANQRHEASVFPDLWSIDLPPNVRLVVTARTHRLSILQVPPNVASFDVRGFELVDSTAHLRQRYGLATDTQGQAFHERSAGNPRVQQYALEASASADDPLDAALRLAGKSPDTMFGDLFQAAHDVSSSDADDRLLSLVCLTRPISTIELSSVWQVGESDVLEFVSALEPGIRIRAGELGFRDENFDTYLRDRFDPERTKAGHQRLVDHYAPKATRDRIAATVVGDHLAGAGRYSELLELAHAEIPQAAIPEPLLRLRTRQRRVDLALRVLRGRGAAEEVPLLLVDASRVATSDRALAEIVRRDPELASSFLDPDSVSSAYVRAENGAWEGARLLHAAATFSRIERTRALGRERLAEAEAWIRTELTVARRNGLRLEADDIAAGVEAAFWTRGADDADAWLRSWRPRSMLPVIARLVADRLASTLSADDVARALIEHHLHPILGAFFGGAFARRGMSFDQGCLEKGLRYLRRAPVPVRRGLEGPLWIVDVIEAAARAGLDADLVAPFLNWLPIPNAAVRDWDDGGEWLAALRARATVRAMQARDLGEVAELMEALPALQPGEGWSDRERQRTWLTQMRPVLVLRAAALRRPLSIEETLNALQPGLEQIRSETSHRWYRGDRRYRQWPILVASVLSRVTGGAAFLTEVADLARPLAGLQAPAIWISMASALMPDPLSRPEAIRLLDRAASEVAESTLTASEKTDFLIRAAQTALHLDPWVARDHFDAALAAAGGVDDDRADILRLAARAIVPVSRADARQQAIALRDVVDGIRPYVSESRVLPMNDACAAIARLDMPVALSALSVWADEDIHAIEELLGPALQGFSSDAAVPTRLIWELHQLADETLDPETAVRLMERERSSRPGGSRDALDLARSVSRWVTRDAAMDQRGRFARAIREWAMGHRLASVPGMAQLDSMAQFLDSLPDRAPGPRVAPFPSRDDLEAPSHGSHERFRDGDFEGLEQHLDELEGSASDTVHGCLRQVREVVPPEHRVAFLDAVASLWRGNQSRVWHTEALVEALRLTAEDGKHSPRVRAWVEQKGPVFVAERLSALVRMVPYEVTALRDISMLPGMTPDSFVNAILDGLAALAGPLEPAQYLALATIATECLDDEGRSRVGHSVLSRVASELPKPSRTFQPGGIPIGIDESLAGFLMAQFGSDDRRARGRALHVAIALADQRPPFVDHLVRELDRGVSNAFLSTSLPPLTLSARTWLLFALSHVARHSPALLFAHASTISAAALDASCPHVQIRELAKRTAMTLEQARPGTFDAATVDALRHVNVSPHKRRRVATWAVDDGRHLDDSFRFRFDPMDVLPYWYAPLADVFNVSTSEVARRAERWIVDEWGIGDDDWLRDRRELRDREGRTRPDHGSLPRHEVTRTYAEYHGMQMAAGELIQAAPVVSRRWGSGDPWGDWLHGGLDTDQDFLLADLRAPTPLLAPAFGVTTSPFETTFEPAYFDQFIGLSDPAPNRIVVSGYIDVRLEREHQTVSIASALVSPVPGMALVWVSTKGAERSPRKVQRRSRSAQHRRSLPA